MADGHGRRPFGSHVEIEAVPVPPRASCGPEPAAVRSKAAFRAALRPDRTSLDMAGPRPARGLKEPCLAANLPCSPRSARTLKRPSFRRFFQSAPEGGPARSRSGLREPRKDML
jgi:hypothetical protein